MKRQQREVIFLASIDYSYSFKDKHDPKPLSLSSNQFDDNQARLQDRLKRAINADLPTDLQRIYGLNVQTRVIDFDEGSILVYFSVLFSGITLFATYAGFWDSVKLVREHSRFLLQKAMGYRGASDYDILVNARYPAIPTREEIRDCYGLGMRLHRKAHMPWRDISNRQFLGRDGFFWFLIGMNVVLIAIVIALVTPAVLKTYFP